MRCRFPGEKISIWHGLCSMASIRPFARPPLTLGVARRRCLRPCGMTAYPRAFNLAVNLAKHVLFVLFYERQTPVFVLHVLSHICQTRARVPAASPAHTRRNRLRPTSSSAEHKFGFVVPLRHANPLHSFTPLDFFSQTQVRVCG